MRESGLQKANTADVSKQKNIVRNANPQKSILECFEHIVELAEDSNLDNDFFDTASAHIRYAALIRSLNTGILSSLAVIEQFMTTVKDSLAHGENVYLRGFGSFIVKQRAAKTARNISKNTTIIIPAHNIPAFKPADIFKEEVAK